MRKRNEWYNKSDPNKRLYYQVAVEPLKVDKLVFDILVEKFGEKKVLDLINQYSRDYSLMHSFFDFINPNNNFSKEEINKLIDNVIEEYESHLSFNCEEAENISDYLK